MEQISPHIREFLEDSFNNEKNGLINYHTIIEIDKYYKLNLNIDYKKYYDNNNKLGLRPVRCNCLDTILCGKIEYQQLLLSDFETIINNKIQKNNNYKEFSI